MGNWKDKNKQREWQRNRYKDRKNFVLKYKINSGGCKNCGFIEEPEILVFHHKNPNEKSFKIGGNWIVNSSIKRLEMEMKKCYILCPNCHAIEHLKDKEWFAKMARTNTKAVWCNGSTGAS